MPNPTNKMIGDAGEHYAVSQFIFAGKPATKMPDGWEAYDLAVEGGSGLLRVSVKTRTERDGWRRAKFFTFDDRRQCDWMVFVFLSAEAEIRAWVMPFDVALDHATRPGPDRQEPQNRDMLWTKLNSETLRKYEVNWKLSE